MLIRLILSGCLLLTPVAAATAIDPPAGGKVEWARLKTSSPAWARHAKSDSTLLQYIRTSTTLNIDPIWRSADVDELPQLCAYPFLFSDGVSCVDTRGRQNLHEYIQRGGFLFIDACIAPQVNPRQDIYLEEELAAMRDILPDLRLETIPPNHEIFHNCFDMADGLPHTRWTDGWPAVGLTAIYSQNRLVSIISLSGLQCGWDGILDSQVHSANCMKMMINIYTYAITH